MSGIEAFNPKGSPKQDDHLILNARSIPVLEAGIANIKLGVFSVVCRRISEKWEDLRRSIALGYTIKCAIFGEAPYPIRIGDVIGNADDVLRSEIDATLADESIRGAVALAYAAEIIHSAWRTAHAGGSLRSSGDIVDRAVAYGMDIPNIVELWGPSAINTFFLASIDFMQRSVDPENL